MQKTTLAGLLARSSPYETWRAPIDERLRMATILAGPITLVGFLLTLALPAMLSALEHNTLLILSEQLAGILRAVAWLSPILVAVNLGSLVAYLFLLALTNGFSVGRALYHWLAGAEVLIGALNGFVVAVALGIIAINLALVILALVLIGVVVFVGFLSFGASQS